MIVYKAKDADIIGRVTLNNNVSVWYHSTLRAEEEDIIIGEGSNIQDNCVIHVDPGFPVVLGKHVTIGHGAILHGCEIDDNTIIGMGAIILNGAQVGKNCIIGAGSLITQNKTIPDNSLVFGNPAKIIRTLSEDEVSKNEANATIYIEEAKAQLEKVIL